MKYPVLLRARKNGPVLAKIYKPAPAYPRYRLAWSVGGKRMMKAFSTYSAAKRHGDGMLGDLAKGSQVTLLTPDQATDALAAMERLRGFFAITGRKVSLLAGISAYCEAALKLGTEHSLDKAVTGFLTTVATVKRVDVMEAAKQFIEARKPKTIAKEGKRPQLSKGYNYNFNMWLKEFASALPGHAVCDLTSDHLDVYLAQHSDLSAKSRNERRGVVRMFLKWAIEKDYLRQDTRLLAASVMKMEVYEPEEIELYTPEELSAIMARADKEPVPAVEGQEAEAHYKHLVPVIALIGLGGVRLQEAVRLTFEDAFRVEGHVEISGGKSKTRSRRLVTMNDALGQWLEPYRSLSGPVWNQCLDKFHTEFGALLDELKIAPRRNGLRHGFCSYHYGLHADEGLTAKEAGNSPAMVHGNYKGLATKKQAEAWFAVAPGQPANVVPMRAKA